MSEPSAPAAPAAPAATPATAPSIVDKIGAMIAAESAPPPKQEAPVEESGEAPDGETTAAEEEYQPGTNKGTEGEEAPSEEPAPAEEPETKAVAEIPLDQLEAIDLEVTLKGDDGKDVVQKKSIKELREGYMRQADYSRKTAEVARQREEVPEKIRQGVESARSHYVQELQVLQAVLLETAAPELKDVDWNKLATEDAFQYVRLQNRAKQIQDAVTNVQKKIAEATEKSNAEAKAIHSQRAAKAIETLEARIPGWNDTLYQTLITAGKDYGFKAEEVGSWLDPRSLEVLHDAYQFRQQKAKLTPPPTTKKVVVPPKVLKPGVTPAQSQARARQTESLGRLQKSGSIQDAAAVIKARFG